MQTTEDDGVACILVTVAELTRLRRVEQALRDLAEAVLEDMRSCNGVVSVDTEYQARVAIEETLA
jgi:hypothetical protein